MSHISARRRPPLSSRCWTSQRFHCGSCTGYLSSFLRATGTAVTRILLRNEPTLV